MSLKTTTILNDIPIYKYLDDGKNIYKIKNISECKDKINNIFNGKLKDLTNEGYEVVKNLDLPYISNRLKEVYKYVLDKNNF